MTDQQRQALMRRAIQLSVENVQRGGGPFGAVIVKDWSVTLVRCPVVKPMRTLRKGYGMVGVSRKWALKPGYSRLIGRVVSTMAEIWFAVVRLSGRIHASSL